jgi:hypothetical protein
LPEEASRRNPTNSIPAAIPFPISSRATQDKLEGSPGNADILSHY